MISSKKSYNRVYESETGIFCANSSAPRPSPRSKPKRPPRKPPLLKLPLPPKPRLKLQLVGVGYRVSNTGNLLELSLGYSHAILFELPKEIKVETKSERNQDPLIMLESCDKQLLGQVCAKIRSFRKPEPYKGKGVLFAGEVVRRKSGKSAGAK